ncbi:MAG: ABC transporter permease [Planctomycetota bacterium]|jgi:ABC-type polysaccharide/polyol phosphate export permease
MQIVNQLKEVFAYRELIYALGMREVRVRYKHSVLGIAWALIMPLSLMLVFTFVFSKVTRLDNVGMPYAIYAYIGLVPWQLHANIINNSARSLSDNSNLVTKVYFAREALPLSSIFSALVDFFVASLVLVGLMIYFNVSPGPGVVLLPLVLLVQLAFCAAMAFLLSAANLLYRDVQYMLQVGVTLWMFVSSVVYPIPYSGTFATLVYVNPMIPILDTYRSAITGNTITLTPEFGVAAAISFAMLFVSWRWFRAKERVFGELA